MHPSWSRRRFAWPRLARPLILALVLIAALPALAQPAAAHQSDHIAARLGISAGAAIEDVPLGLQGRELRQRNPIVFATAARLDVRIQAASAGRGFWADNGVLLSEKDLDFVVTGRRDLIFVANTGDEPEPTFFARMERVRALLGRAGIPTGPVRCDRAHFLALNRDSYDGYIGDTAVPRLAAATASSARGGQPQRACT